MSVRSSSRWPLESALTVNQVKSLETIKEAPWANHEWVSLQLIMDELVNRIYTYKQTKPSEMRNMLL